jgi:drug/metabolite transporter (DMT)-like permease
LRSTPSRPTLTLGLLGGVLAVSAASIFIRFAQNEGAPSIVIAAYRLTIASLVLAPLALTRHRSELQQLARREWALALLSGFFLAIHFATWITSLQYTSIASSVVLVSTAPLWVALLSPFVLHERISRSAVIGLALALTGSIAVGLSDSCTWQAGRVACPPLQTFLARTTFLGDFLALVGAWMAAGYMLVGRRLRAKMDLVPYVTVVYGMAAVVLIAIMFGRRESPLGYSPSVYLWVILLGLVPQLIGHSTYNWALRYMPASFVSVALLGEPIGSTILAYIIFQEQPSWLKIIGAVSILAGIWLASRTDGKADRPEK